MSISDLDFPIGYETIVKKLGTERVTTRRFRAFPLPGNFKSCTVYLAKKETLHLSWPVLDTNAQTEPISGL